MTEEGLRYPNRDLLVMFIVLIFSFTIVEGASYFIFHFSPDIIVASLAGELVFIGMIMTFLVYRQRFQDERSMRILDKSGRNGFVSMLYLLPLFLFIISLLEYSIEVAWVLIEFWGCSAVIVILSAIYYYRK